jgi:hypothetical protein
MDENDDKNDPILLARKLTGRAISRLGELMECDGRQAMVAVLACKAMLEIGYPELNEERIRKLVEEKLADLITEAERRRPQQIAAAR